MTAFRDTDPGIEALYRSWSEACRRRDLAAVFDLLTPDSLLWATGAAPMTRDDFAPRLRVALDT